MVGELSVAYGWLIAGALLLALEAFGIPGVGLLFAGLAAITVGTLVHVEVVASDDLLMQAGIFGGITAFFALLLWKKLKRWRTDPNSSGRFSNIVGDLATVGQGGLHRGTVGQASWSGTTMMARISDKAGVDAIGEGTMVEIVDVKGSQLIVAPRREGA